MPNVLEFPKPSQKFDFPKLQIEYSPKMSIFRYIGSRLMKDHSLELGRITGLDPAEPHFEFADPITRLDPSDAFFVDVIHTDGNPLMSLGLGVYQPCGHLDFYPNGGKVMAGCDRSFVSSLAQESIKNTK